MCGHTFCVSNREGREGRSLLQQDAATQNSMFGVIDIASERLYPSS